METKLKGEFTLQRNEGILENEVMLSVLICTIDERYKEFLGLWNNLLLQTAELGSFLDERVEILSLSDDRINSIGAKRNYLLEQSQGKYVCFIDDDDFIADLYLIKLLDVIYFDMPDVVGFKILCENYPTVGQSKIAEVGLPKETWRETREKIYRPPYHKTPIKRELALQAKFPEISFGEDAEYSRRLKGLVKTSGFTDDILYYYQAPLNPSRARYAQRK